MYFHGRIYSWQVLNFCIDIYFFVFCFWLLHLLDVASGSELTISLVMTAAANVCKYEKIEFYLYNHDNWVITTG